MVRRRSTGSGQSQTGLQQQRRRRPAAAAAAVAARPFWPSPPLIVSNSKFCLHPASTSAHFLPPSLLLSLEKVNHEISKMDRKANQIRFEVMVQYFKKQMFCETLSDILLLNVYSDFFG